jgi:replicative DNA helicase
LGLSSSLVDLSFGDQILIASRPSGGKTSLGLLHLDELSLKNKQSCAYFTIEIDEKTLMKRWICLKTNISYDKLTRGLLSEQEILNCANVFHEISQTRVFFNNSSINSVEEIVSRVQILKRNNSNLKYVFIDYINLIGTRKGYDSRTTHVNDILQQLKKMAIDEKIVVISLAQANRHLEKYAIPNLTNLREVSDLSSIDKVVLLHSEENFKRDDFKFYSFNKNEIIKFMNTKNSNKILTSV